MDKSSTCVDTAVEKRREAEEAAFGQRGRELMVMADTLMSLGITGGKAYALLYGMFRVYADSGVLSEEEMMLLRARLAVGPAGVSVVSPHVCRERSFEHFDGSRAGRCYYVLSQMDATVGGLGEYPSFLTMLSSDNMAWDLSKFWQFHIRLADEDCPDVFHVASEGSLAIFVFTELAMQRSDWPEGSLGRQLVRQALPVASGLKARLTSVLGGDPGADARVASKLRPKAYGTKPGDVAHSGMGWTDDQVEEVRQSRRVGYVGTTGFWDCFVPGYIPCTPDQSDARSNVMFFDASDGDVSLPINGRDMSQRWFAPSGCQFVFHDAGDMIFPDYRDVEGRGDRIVTVGWTDRMARVSIRFPNELWGTRVSLRRHIGPAVAEASVTSNAHLVTRYASALVPSLELPQAVAPHTVELDEGCFQQFNVRIWMPSGVDKYNVVLRHPALVSRSAWLLHDLDRVVVTVGGARAYGIMIDALRTREYTGDYEDLGSGTKFIAVAAGHDGTVYLTVMRPEAHVGDDYLGSFHLSSVYDDYHYDEGGPDIDELDFDRVAWSGCGLSTPLLVKN